MFWRRCQLACWVSTPSRRFSPPARLHPWEPAQQCRWRTSGLWAISGKLRYHVILNIRGVVFEEQHPAELIARFMIVAVFLDPVRADIVSVPLWPRFIISRALKTNSILLPWR